MSDTTLFLSLTISLERESNKEIFRNLADTLIGTKNGKDRILFIKRVIMKEHTKTEKKGAPSQIMADILDTFDDPATFSARLIQVYDSHGIWEHINYKALFNSIYATIKKFAKAHVLEAKVIAAN